MSHWPIDPRPGGGGKPPFPTVRLSELDVFVRVKAPRVELPDGLIETFMVGKGSPTAAVSLPQSLFHSNHLDSASSNGYDASLE
jgi:hypothetical protein